MEQALLPWSVDPREVRRFRLILLVMALAALAVGILVPLTELPERTREELEALPPQLARVVLEKTQFEPPPPPPPPKEEVREEPPKVEAKPEPAPEPKPKPKVQQPEKSEVEKAREVAQNTGLLALKDDLADMREAMSASSFNAELSSGRVPVMTGTSERLVSSVSTASSGGVNTSGMASLTERIEVGSRETTQLAASEAPPPVQKTETATADKPASRTLEELRRVFDANKAALYAIYSRALRQNPSLQGQILLELTIEPSGQVSHCRVLSSELGDPELERRILARVKLFDFGSKKVKAETFTWPLDFLPS